MKEIKVSIRSQALAITCALFALLISKSSMAQEERKEEGELTKKQSIAIAIGHTQVAKGFQEGQKKWLSLPSWAVDYTYRLNPIWSLGLQNELILSDFEVESEEGNGQVITRSTPLASIAVVGYRPLEYLTLFAGAGGEFAKEEDFAVVRLGVEPSMEIRERLELLASLVYDFKIDGYNSFGLSVGVAYTF
jgi:opacity protein-like surface antigen